MEEIVIQNPKIYGRLTITLTMPIKHLIMKWANKSGLKKTEFYRISLMIGAAELAERIKCKSPEEGFGQGLDAPLTKRGEEFRRKPIMPQEFIVDYFRVTVHASTSTCMALYEEHFEMVLSKLEDVGHGAKGYKGVLKGLGGFQLKHSPGNGREYCTFEFPGDACGATPPEFFKLFFNVLLKRKYKFSVNRIDFAFDHVPFTPRQVLPQCQSGQKQARSRTANLFATQRLHIPEVDSCKDVPSTASLASLYRNRWHKQLALALRSKDDMYLLL